MIMELIDKAEVVAEIDRRKHKLLDNIMFERDKEWVVRTAHQLNRIILFLDTLETKEEEDSFIEKAWDWIDNNLLSANQQDKSRLYFEQFVNYMKGE